MSRQVRQQQNDSNNIQKPISFANMGSKRTKSHQIKQDSKPVVELLYETDEDYRLGRVGKSQGHAAIEEIQELKKNPERRKKVFDVYEESPNGYHITSDAPTSFDEAVKHYSFLLRQFTVELPDEHGLIHYTLGKVFLAEERATDINDHDKKGKLIENAVFHFDRAKEIFTAPSHPIMYAIICTILGQLYRTRTLLITNRSFLSKRTNPLDSIGMGLSYVSEALQIFFTSQVHLLEYAICSLESGWLYLLQELEDRGIRPELADENREMAISHLERAISLMEEANKTNRVRQFNYADSSSYPLHIKLLLYSRSLYTVEGMAYYLLGVIYQDWSLDREHQDRAFDLFSSSVKSKYLQMDCEEWVDAHHRVANVIIRCPYVVDPEWTENSSTDIYLLSAIAHLELGLRSPRVDHARRIDMNFHLAQAHILRLHTITDHVPHGQSLTQALISREGLDIIQSAEECLLFACKGVTAANLQSTQDAYIYYFSCLKLAEFRMLEAACQVNAPISKREELLTFSVLQILNALHARSLEDNFDLHYIATIQMAQMITAAKRYIAGMKTYAKGLIVLQALVNRMPFNKESIQKKMADESSRQASQALLAMSKDTIWIRKHLGPFVLIDIQTPTPGYTLWSFQEDEKFPDESDEDTGKQKKGSKQSPSKLPSTEIEQAKKENIYVKPIAKPPLQPPPQFNPSDTKVPRLNLQLATHNTGLPPLSAFGLDHNADNKTVYRKRRHKYIPSLEELHGNDGHSSTFSRQGLKKDRASVLFSGASNILETQSLTTKSKKNATTPKKVGFLSRMFGIKAAAESKGRKDLPKNAKEESCRIWSSTSCLYTVMILSRLSRLHLVIRAHALKAYQGERAINIINSLVPSLRDEYKSATKGLKVTCDGLVVPPATLKELSLRSYDDLQKIFKSYPEIHRQLLAFESFLFEKLIHEDCFIPSIHAGSALTTDLEAYNVSLLDSSRVLDGLRRELEKNAKKPAPSTSSPTKIDTSKQPALFTGLLRQEEEQESLRLGRMTSELSQNLDGSLHGDVRHLFSKYLKNDDCMLLWHLPQSSSQKLQLVLIWKKPVTEHHSFFHSKSSKKVDGYNSRDVVMELARSEVNTSQMMSLVNTFLETTKVNPQPLRLSNMTDVIRSMSCLLSLSEVLVMIPPHVKSLIICCPPAMRLIPWNSMLIEIPSDTVNIVDIYSPTNYKEVYLLDNYSIRLGPSLNLFEISSIAANNLKHALGMHRLCAIDGEELSSAGIRSTEMEVACVTQTFSAEPSDYHVIMGNYAAATCLRSGDSPKIIDEIKRRKNEKRTRDEVDSDDDHWDALDLNKKSLTSCRILHIAALKVRLDLNTSIKVAAIELPRSREARKAAANINKNTSKSAKILSQVDMFSGSADKRDSLNSKEFVAQLFVRNCALCVLSRFGIADDIIDIRQADVNVEFLEAAHMSGATTLLYPIWSGGTQGGVGILASQVFLIRFYTELPFHSADKRSVVTACRRAQLWLRDVTGDKTIEFLNQTPIPKKARDELIQEMNRFIEASVASGTPYYDPTIAPGDRHYFKHPLYWSNWTVSGWGGNVHHPDLHDLEDEDEIEKGNTGGKHFHDDPELDNIEFELEILKKEGKLDEAAELETFLRKRKVKKLQERVEQARLLTAKAGRGILDSLEIIDRIVLDQDEDEIEISDDEKKTKKKKPEKAKRKVIGDSKSAKVINVESTAKEDDDVELFKSGGSPSSSPSPEKTGYFSKFMGTMNSMSARMLRPLNDDGTLVDEEFEKEKNNKDVDEYYHEYDYDSGDDADIGTFGALIGYEGRKHVRMFKRSIEIIKGEVRSKEEANEVAKQLIRDSQAEANRLAKLALEKGKEQSKLVVKKIIDKAKTEAKKIQDRKLIKNNNDNYNNNNNDTLRTENKQDTGSEVCSIM